MEQKRLSIATLVAVLLVGLIALYGAFKPEAPISGFTPRGVTNFTGLEVAAPTYQPTGTPAAVIDSAGVSVLFEVRDAATPVVAVNNGGNVEMSGDLALGSYYPLEYGTAGEVAVAASQDITGTAEVAHGLTTVTWAVCTLGEDPSATSGHAAHVTVAISTNVVTVKAWQDDFVTEATETDVTTYCLVIGTP